jgi:hypothetical protein
MWLSIGSGEQTESGLIYGGRCWLSSVLIITDGTNACTAVIHDNETEGAGKKLYESKVVGADDQKHINILFASLGVIEDTVAAMIRRGAKWMDPFEFIGRKGRHGE